MESTRSFLGQLHILLAGYSILVLFLFPFLVYYCFLCSWRYSWSDLAGRGFKLLDTLSRGSVFDINIGIHTQTDEQIYLVDENSYNHDSCSFVLSLSLVLFPFLAEKTASICLSLALRSENALCRDTLFRATIVPGAIPAAETALVLQQRSLGCYYYCKPYRLCYGIRTGLCFFFKSINADAATTRLRREVCLITPVARLGHFPSHITNDEHPGKR